MTTIINNINSEVMDHNDKENQKLLARVHLEAQDVVHDHHGKKKNISRWRKFTAKSTLLYRDPQTGGTIHVGNALAARSKVCLDTMGPSPCRKIVYCQENKGTSSSSSNKKFENNPEFEYFHFPIAKWGRDVGFDDVYVYDPTDCLVLEYFQPLFDFLDREMECGNSVLIHCFAGAHRAGTCAIGALMYLTGMKAKEATRTAQSLRPIINPVGGYSQLLALLEGELQS